MAIETNLASSRERELREKHFGVTGIAGEKPVLEGAFEVRTKKVRPGIIFAFRNLAIPVLLFGGCPTDDILAGARNAIPALGSIVPDLPESPERFLEIWRVQGSIEERYQKLFEDMLRKRSDIL